MPHAVCELYKKLIAGHIGHKCCSLSPWFPLTYAAANLTAYLLVRMLLFVYLVDLEAASSIQPDHCLPAQDTLVFAKLVLEHTVLLPMLH